MPRMKKPPDKWRKMSSIVNQLYDKKNEYITETRRKAQQVKNKRIFDKRKSVVATLGNNNIMALQREAMIQNELKQYCWMAGESKKLDQTKAQVLRDMIDNFQCMLSAAVVDVIFDTGASKSLTPFKSDFVGKIIPCNIQLKGIGSGMTVAGKGTVKWKFRNEKGELVEVLVEAYYVPDIKFRLFSPQSYFQTSGDNGEFKMNKNGTFFIMKDECIKLTFNAANLPVANILITEDNGNEDNLDSLLCGSDENINLTRTQRHLLMWHHQIGHASFRLIRWLGRKKYLTSGDVDQSSTILCDSCRLARAAKRPVEKADDVSQKAVNGLKYNSIKNKDLKPGDYVSIDQYTSRKHGRLSKGFGKAPANETYAGGTIFVDHASGYIHVEHQISLRAPDTIIAKRNFERIMYDKGASVKTYRSDNGVFALSDFENAIKKEDQTITYSGVGASHQNGVAERAI
eukprot:CAMPEP_0196825070 /NCGR_PEP_ID=MMETSP1362-20130617/92843_1 /TAXON_ID=163516 /ORGANISM="Leptocylindrus danicus, Strain CCMP1856" /LENGTH=456 /DNA_ID=CAMNT_0042205443 /DNA_START=1757 /DNA_END=3127 /DNA_ORIENTATION=+